MIVSLLINLIVLILGAIFSWFPVVTKLPTIGGFDIDTALVSGVGQFLVYTDAIWPLKIMFYGFLALMGYYLTMMIVRFFLGHRSPQH
jgi:hypothetical protein